MTVEAWRRAWRELYDLTTPTRPVPWDGTREAAFWTVFTDWGIEINVAQYHLDQALFDLGEPEGMIKPGEPRELFALAWHRIQTRGGTT